MSSLCQRRAFTLDDGNYFRRSLQQCSADLIVRCDEAAHAVEITSIICVLVRNCRAAGLRRILKVRELAPFRYYLFAGFGW
jgi:hypothetical protein